MRQKLDIPVFESEADEADWWFDNREAVEADMLQAIQEGDVIMHPAGLGTDESLDSNTAILLPMEDSRKAKAAAQKRGLTYEEYVREVVHEALEKETAA